MRHFTTPPMFYEALVVLDAKHEIGFWWGREYIVGDVSPGILVEVL